MRTTAKGPRAWVWTPCRRCGNPIIHEPQRHLMCAICRRRQQDTI